MKKKLHLFLVMMKIGLFTFGGGYAMIALLESEFVDKKKWLNKEEFLDMVAIAESTPGPIAINSATYIGYRLAGFWGSLFATLGVCIPSFAIIYVISLFLDAFLEITCVAYAFKGIQVCVIYLIFSAGIRLFKGLQKNAFNMVLLFAILLLMTACSLLSVNFSTIGAIIISGGLGVVVYLVNRRINKGREEVR